MDNAGTVTLWLEHLLGGLGPWAYPVVFILVFAETGLLVPVPAETALVVASFLAARGQLSIYGLVALAALGAVAGDMVAYRLGRGVGRRRILERGRFLFLKERELVRVGRFFARHGGKTVFFGRFVAILRICSAFFAGMSEMPVRPFMAWNVSGGIVWAACFGALGYLFGQWWERIHRWLGWGGLGVLVALVLGGIALVHWQTRKAMEQPAPPTQPSGPAG